VGTTGVVTIVNGKAFETEPPALVTVIDAVPTLAIRAAGTFPVNPKKNEFVVVSGTPFQLITAPDEMP
jgi:hypothetical protein